MSAMSTELMEKISSFVDQYYSAKHTTPSVNEIALGVGIPKTTTCGNCFEICPARAIEKRG